LGFIDATEAMVEKARKAKEEAATRAAIALEKARGATAGSFLWPWQKEGTEDNLSSKTSAVNEDLEQSEDVPPPVDSEPKSSSST